MQESYFEGKVAVITGGGGILCSHIAMNLAQRGARIVLIGRDVRKLQKVADEVKDFGGFCVGKKGDVSREKEMQEIAKEVREELGCCDILVNGAGGNNPGAITTDAHYRLEKPGEDSSKDTITFFNADMGIFRNVIDVNLMGAVLCCRAFGSQMVESGGGVILNFASMNSYRPLSCRPAYAMSKAAIVNFTQWLANYLAPTGIRVNAVAPGFVTNANNIKFYGSLDTGYTTQGANILSHTPMGRFGTAEEIWGTVEWLLNDERSGFVTGITVPIDGGFLTCSGI